MRHIKSLVMKRKKANTMPIEKVDIRDLMVRDDLVEVALVEVPEVRQDSTFEILILAILWVVFLVGDSAADLQEKAHKVEKTFK
ncbi:MAG: hypothetical protein WCL18_08685 [bacterium]